MKKYVIILLVFLTPFLCDSQTITFPTNLGIAHSSEFINNAVKITTFPFYADNQHPFPSLKNKRTFDWEYLGLTLHNNVPMVCLDDFRYGHKFENTIGSNGIGFLSLDYWLPSNGNYLLFYFTLDNGMDYYRAFLVTTTLSGVYIDNLLVCDGWRDNPNINFTQATIDNNLAITLYEIRNLNTTYIPIGDLSTFTGKKAVLQYSINTNGTFVLNSTTLGNQRTFNISELKGLISNIAL